MKRVIRKVQRISGNKSGKRAIRIVETEASLVGELSDEIPPWKKFPCAKAPRKG